MERSGIYRIEIGSRVFYYGSSSYLANRRSSHRRAFERGIHANPRLQRAFDKHGDFRFVVVEACAPERLLEVEQRYLDQWCGHRDCANVLVVAGSPAGIRRSASVRRNMSIAARQRVSPPLTTEHRASISAGLRGRLCNPATRALISAAHSAPVRAVTPAAVLIWPSATVAAEQLGTSIASVSRWCRAKNTPRRPFSAWRFDRV